MRYPHLPAVGSLDAPELHFHESPNVSERRHGMRPEVVFNHVWGGGSFHGVVDWLSEARSQASAHVVYAGEIGPDAGKAFQLVPWSRKAWTECSLNDFGIGLEFADAIWRGHDPHGFAAGARMTALILHIHGLPPRWVRGQALLGGTKGHSRHADGGRMGCGHVYCPTSDLDLYEQFHERVVAEVRHGGFRDKYGKV